MRSLENALQGKNKSNGKGKITNEPYMVIILFVTGNYDLYVENSYKTLKKVFNFSNNNADRLFYLAYFI
jgi:hypothetical protein